MRDGNGTVLLTTFSRPLRFLEGLSFRVGVRSRRGEEFSYQLLKLVLDVPDVALWSVEMELLAEWGLFFECVRGEARLSVRGDFGGTFGGISPVSLRAIGRKPSISCLPSTADGMINGFNSFEISNHDRLSTSFRGECVGCKQSAIPPFSAFGKFAARGVLSSDSRREVSSGRLKDRSIP